MVSQYEKLENLIRQIKGVERNLTPTARAAHRQRDNVPTWIQFILDIDFDKYPALIEELLPVAMEHVREQDQREHENQMTTQHHARRVQEYVENLATETDEELRAILDRELQYGDSEGESDDEAEKAAARTILKGRRGDDSDDSIMKGRREDDSDDSDGSDD
jgi:hypothetical protein